MKEVLFTAGKNYDLHGVIGLPEDLGAKKTAVVFLNSGLMHHIGTCRTSVIFSRALVESGFLTVRFDFSGIGDTPPASVVGDDEQRIIDEVKQVLDYVQTEYSINRFVLYGLCSGARNSFAAALQDERVVGLFGIDSHAYRTKKFYWHSVFPRVISPMFWQRVLKYGLTRLCKKLGFIKDTPNALPPAKEELWAYPNKSVVERGYKQLVHRSVKFFQVYTGNWRHEYNYEKQFYDMYSSVNFGKQLTVMFRPEMSHIMAEPESQELLTQSFLKWMKTFK